MHEEIKRHYRPFAQLKCGLVLLGAMAWIVNAQEQRPRETSPSSAIHARHILGFEDQKRDADGELLITGFKPFGSQLAAKRQPVFSPVSVSD